MSVQSAAVAGDVTLSYLSSASSGSAPSSAGSGELFERMLAQALDGAQGGPHPTLSGGERVSAGETATTHEDGPTEDPTPAIVWDVDMVATLLAQLVARGFDATATAPSGETTSGATVGQSGSLLNDLARLLSLQMTVAQVAVAQTPVLMGGATNTLPEAAFDQFVAQLASLASAADAEASATAASVEAVASLPGGASGLDAAAVSGDWLTLAPVPVSESSEAVNQQAPAASDHPDELLAHTGGNQQPRAADATDALSGGDTGASDATTFAERTANASELSPSFTAAGTRVVKTADTSPRGKAKSASDGPARPQTDGVLAAGAAAPGATGITASAERAPDSASVGHRLVDQIVTHVVTNARLVQRDGRTEIRFQLQPESLGRLSVQVIVHDGQMTLRVGAESLAVKSLIESNLAQLRSALQEQGITTGGVQVYVGGSFAQGDGQSRQPRERQGTMPRWSSQSENVSSVQGANATRRSAGGSGSIDYRV